MAKKPLGLDAQGIQKQMRLPNYLGDGATALALNSLSGLTGVIVYFYTDKVGIAAAAAGTIMFIARIVDALTDLGMGWIMDHTRSRWGRARPWFLWMAVPTFISIIALFLVPSGASSGTKFGFALGTNILASAIVYTAIAVPFGSMLFYATRSTEERSKMGITRAVFGYIIGMVLSIGYIPITNALGGDQRAWVMFAAAFAVLAVIGLLAAFFANPERNPDPPSTQQSAVPFLESIRMLFTNRYWVIMLVVMLLANIIYALSSGSGIYYVKWILGDENLMALLGTVGLIPVVVGFAAVGPLVKLLGPAKTVRIALLIGIAGSLVRVVFPYELWALLGFGALVTLSTIPIMAVGGVLVNNTVAYGEWKFGKRQVGMANAANSFGVKVGTGIGAASIGWILALGHYDGAAATQPDSAITAILVISIGVPLAILIGMYVLMRFYDLDTKYAQIVQELEERKQGAQSVS
ncbi:MAG: sugar (glycoside-pentoside-Hexuronide) transporter [Actinomyces ruminicola]|nr:sugar (glycoside-pentoside-Hexuronide) transporter [Actinomyces ruminicola]